MKILLINPPFEVSADEVVNIIAPLGLAYLASVLEKARHKVQIIDLPALSWKNPIRLKSNRSIFRYSPPDQYILETALEFDPDLIGISNLFSSTEKETINLARKLKKILPKAKIVVGGPNASVRPEIFINSQNIDFVVVGEGELTILDLVKNLKKREFRQVDGLIFKTNEGKIETNQPRLLIETLDKLPFPSWHLLPMDEYLSDYHAAGVFVKKERVATVLMSRGCPNPCNFCTNEKVWSRKWRSRSVANVLLEIKLLKKIYKIKEVQFVDSNISVKREQFKRLCKALKKEKICWLPSGGIAVSTLDPHTIKLIADSGCYALQFGIEHGSLEIQKRIGKIVPLEKTRELVKACHKHGIWTHGNFIVGLPGETKATAYESVNYAIKADLDSVSFFTALPLPGSRVYQELIHDKKINPDDMRFYVSKSRCSELTNYQVKQIIRQSFRKFLVNKVKREFHPSSVYSRIKQIKSLDDLRFYLAMFRRLLHIRRAA